MQAGSGTTISDLSFEARGEASNEPQPIVLSCGGMFIPGTPVSERPVTWRQIILLPGPELSTRIFGASLERLRLT